MPIKIFIDQGHNPSGFNAGAEGFGLKEQNITYIVGIYLNDLLNSNSNFTSRVSRKTPTQSLGISNATSLKARVDEANEWGADYFISIHTNGSVNPTVNGSEVYIYSKQSSVYNLAQSILNSIVRRMKTKNRGVLENPKLYVLRKTQMPSVLVELAFITNYEDSQKMKNDPYGFAYAIYSGIIKYFGLDE